MPNFLRKVAAQTGAAVLEARQAQLGQAASARELDRFMTALFRVAEESNVWRTEILVFLAPVVFALDAELNAQAAGEALPLATLVEEISATIRALTPATL